MTIVSANLQGPAIDREVAQMTQNALPIFAQSNGGQWTYHYPDDDHGDEGSSWLDGIVPIQGHFWHSLWETDSIKLSSSTEITAVTLVWYVHPAGSGRPVGAQWTSASMTLPQDVDMTALLPNTIEVDTYWSTHELTSQNVNGTWYSNFRLADTFGMSATGRAPLDNASSPSSPALALTRQSAGHGRLHAVHAALDRVELPLLPPGLANDSPISVSLDEPKLLAGYGNEVDDLVLNVSPP